MNIALVAGRRSARVWNSCAVSVLTIATALVFSQQLQAANPPTIKQVHDAIVAEKYNDARQQANLLLQAGNPAARAQLARPMGRILLAVNDKQAVESYFKTLKNAKLDANAQELISVYKLWALAIDGKKDEAIAGLEEIVKKDRPTYGALEAADILAILELQRDNKEEAKKIVDKALGVIKYNNVQDPYIERLLKRRMSSKWFAKGGDAERLYNDAEALRKQEKFADAGKIYARIQATYPQSTFSDAAGFRIGQCFVGLKQERRAESHWQDFIDANEKGPWRGQAYTALAEASLYQRLDIKSAAEKLRLATEAYENGVDERSLPSWKQAAPQFYLLKGVAALAERRHAEAVTPLASARKELDAAQQTLAKSIERLQKIAADNTGILPPELYKSDSEGQTANSLGRLLVMLNRQDNAQRIFTNLIQGSRASRSAPHRSFAALGLARIYLKQKETEQAKSGYQYSLKQHATGQWHDETLRELALLIEREAAENYPLPENTKNEKGLTRTPDEKEFQIQSQALYRARAEALPYWVNLFQKYPDSPHVPQSLFHMGQLYVESGKIDWAGKSFEKLTAEHQQSAWTGDAHVWLIDVKLEREFDLAAAQHHAREAMQWLKQLDGKAAQEARDKAAASETAGLRTFRAVSYDILVRSGVVEYLDQQHATAAQRFREARKFAPARRFVLVQGKIPTGIEQLIKIAESGKTITPKEVLDGDSKARLMLMLADLYYEGKQYEQAMELCNRVIKGTAPAATVHQQSWAYFKKGRNLHALMLPLDAVPEFNRAAEVGPDAPWCPTALSYAANGNFNYTQDVPKAVASWRRLAARFPESEEAERATYHIGFALEKSGNFREAKRAYDHFIETYPNSDYVRAIRKFHLPVVEENLSKSGTP